MFANIVTYNIIKVFVNMVITIAMAIYYFIRQSTMPAPLNPFTAISGLNCR